MTVSRKSLGIISIVVNNHGLEPVAFAATGFACPPSADNFISGCKPVELRWDIKLLRFAHLAQTSSSLKRSLGMACCHQSVFRYLEIASFWQSGLSGRAHILRSAREDEGGTLKVMVSRKALVFVFSLTGTGRIC